MAFSTPLASPASPAAASRDFFDRNDPNGLMMQMGINYGQSVLQQGLQKGEEGLLRYMPFVQTIRNYFAVNNTYVRRKLGILVFPFLTKYTVISKGGSTAGILNPGADSMDYTDSHLGSGMGMVDEPFGGPLSSPKPGHLAGHPGVVGQGTSSLPINDVLGFDLYIPLMGGITYIIQAAFITGLKSTHVVITAESLWATATVINIWFLVEIIAVHTLSYTLRVGNHLPVLDTISLCGYKYVLLCITTFLSQLFPEGKLYCGALLIYTILAHCFFSAMIVARRYLRDDGRVASRVRVLTYAIAFSQIPSILWMFTRAFYT